MTTSSSDQSPALAEQLAATITGLYGTRLPEKTVAMARSLVLDVLGLCVATRGEDYIKAILSTVDPGGNCTALGHKGSFNAYDAALINGTAAHGEDYDDTFEGGPVHSGAVVVPAVLAACEREGLSGDALLLGVVVGAELMCRLRAAGAAGHPQGRLSPDGGDGRPGCRSRRVAALRLDAKQIASALGIAGSMASGIIEYLAEGTSTKRMHAGWAAQSGIRAALMARGGSGPRTVLEGTHGFYKAFAPSVKPAFNLLMDGFGQEWVMQTIAFKPYACGTMTQPYIDCAIKLAESGIRDDDIKSIVCKVGEGTVHRLWEPLAVNYRPPTPYAAKFSTPYCMAVGFFDRRAGFGQFTEARVRDETLLALAAKISYVIDPANKYPANFTGHLRATLNDGRVIEIEQPHMRGGARDPLSPAELQAKFVDNLIYGGWSEAQAQEARQWCDEVFAQTTMAGAVRFRR